MEAKISKIQSFTYLLVIFTSIFLFFSCNPTKTLKPDELFLQSVKVKSDNKKLNTDEFYSINKQKPNKKILGVFRFHLGMYNLLHKRNKNFGEPPVVYDSLLTQKSLKQFGIYLNNKGYFHHSVSASTKQHGNKIKLFYEIKPGTPYIINELKYEFQDPSIGGYVLYKKENSLIKKGDNFDVDVLDKERERIKKVLKERGYYLFSNNDIKYKVDTTVGDNNVNIILDVLKKKEKNPETLEIEEHSHQKFIVDSINVFVGKNLKSQDVYSFDTVTYKNVCFLYKDKMRFKPKMLRHAINYKPKETYSLTDQNLTYKHLSELKLFRNITIQYQESDSNKLINNIFLTPLSDKAFALEGVGTNTGGDLGIEGNLIFQNKNLFGGGEYLTLKLKGGLEIQRVVSVSSDNENEIFGLPFNTLEFGPEMTLEIPRFLLPFNLENFSKRANPKTTISSTFNIQQRPEYYRNLAQGSFGYYWNESIYKKHFVTPFNISYVNLDLTDEFRNKIIAENNPFLINSYTDHFISAMQYSFIFNNQEINKTRNSTYFRLNFESSGSLLSLYNSATNQPKDETTNAYEFAGIRYAEYLKSEFDLRFYQRKENTSLVQRIAVGAGVPFGNLNVLPFEKSYFGGGANGIRAWQARTLGPGSLPDSLTSTINQIGEVKVEANIEYRFDLTKVFEGAFFIDAGNIWLLNKDKKRPNSEINLSRFYHDLAIGVGLGLRLDFNFFIIRFDVASPIKNPSANNPKEYKLLIKKTNLNLGIGYPF